MKFVAWRAYHYEAREFVDDYLRRIRDMLCGHDYVECEDVDHIKREIRDADVMIGWRITPEVFAQAKQLKWIQFGSAGIDHTIFPELVNSDVVISTMSGIHTACVAEHVFAQMLALTRRLDIAFPNQQAHKWDRSIMASTSEELAEKTLGIIGLGKIGQSIARIAMSFGMNVVGTKKTPEPGMLVDEVFSPDDLHKMLPKCDIVVLVVPLTSHTRALIGNEEIALMKDGAYLINVARGAMVDHDALNEALISGKLRGAALDVFPQEPLPSDSPIWDIPNVIITPHTGGSSPQYGKRGANIFEHNLNAFLSGGEMVNVYNRNKGY